MPLCIPGTEREAEARSRRTCRTSHSRDLSAGRRARKGPWVSLRPAWASQAPQQRQPSKPGPSELTGTPRAERCPHEVTSWETAQTLRETPRSRPVRSPGPRCPCPRAPLPNQQQQLPVRLSIRTPPPPSLREAPGRLAGLQAASQPGRGESGSPRHGGCRPTPHAPWPRCLSSPWPCPTLSTADKGPSLPRTAPYRVDSTPAQTLELPIRHRKQRGGAAKQEQSLGPWSAR